MTWTCSKCATSHDTDDQRAACQKSQRNLRVLTAGILLAVVALCVAANIAWSVYAYGDWTCAFAECRKIKP